MFDRQAQLFGTEVKKARSVRQTLQRFWEYFRDYRLALVLVSILVVVSVYIQVLAPDLIGQAIDCYLGPASARVTGSLKGAGTFDNCWYDDNPPITADETSRELLELVLLIVALYIGTSIFSGLAFYSMSWAGVHVLRDLRRDIFHRSQVVK